jgi:hypothetical protein
VAYARNATKADPRFTGPIGLDRLYRKGERTHHGFGERLEGSPRVNAVKGNWQDDHAFVIDRLVLGLGEPAERWTLTFDGEKLNVHGKIPDGPEISVEFLVESAVCVFFTRILTATLKGAEPDLRPSPFPSVRRPV